jgi:hypothetical protein
MNEHLSEKVNADRLVKMSFLAGRQDAYGIFDSRTDIVGALKAKLLEFMSTRRVRDAKVKGMIVVTDGADPRAIIDSGGRWTMTPELAQVLAQYARAGIDVTFIGIGAVGGQLVEALDAPRVHHVSIQASRSEDIAEAIAKLAELNRMGSRLPDGELNTLMRIEPTERVKLYYSNAEQ